VSFPARLLAVVCLAGLLAAPTDRATAADTTRGQKLLDDYFRHQVKQIADACLADVKTKADWERQRPELRRQFLDMMGLWPLPPRTDLKATVTGTLDADQFTVEKLHFQSLPGLYVTANLYVPKKVTALCPAVLYVCGHGNTVVDKVSYGSKVNYQHHPAWFAANGYVCLILDTLQLGEIEGLHHGTHRLNMWWWQTLGYTPAGIECWNAMRALDYLETRKEVDRKRLGVTGRSGGGATSWWLAAADDRPQCIIPVAGIADLEAHVVAGVSDRLKKGVINGHCDCMYFVNTYRWDFPMVAALCAPRPLLLGNSDADDIFPVPGYRRLADKVRRAYDLYGAGDRFALLETKGPHKDTPELRQGAFRWMNRWLKGREGDTPDPVRPRFEPQQLKVFDRLPADEINTTVHEKFVKPVLPPGVPQDALQVWKWWPEQRGAWLRGLQDKVFAGWPEQPCPLDVRPAGDVPRDGVRLQAYDFRSEEGVDLRLWLISPEGREKPKAVCLEVADEATWLRLAAHLGAPFKSALLLGEDALPPEVSQARHLVTADRWLAVVAPRGVGPTRWADAASREDIHIRRRFALLGQTLDGQRVWDVRRAVQALGTLPPLTGARLTVRGEREAAGLALYAALFAPSVGALELANPPGSHREGPTLLNVRRVLDLPQAVGLAYPLPVSIKAAKKMDAWLWPLDLNKWSGKPRLTVQAEGP
jgi:cephalosporin-C deacetylase-like acetyl esterase